MTRAEALFLAIAHARKLTADWVRHDQMLEEQRHRWGLIAEQAARLEAAHEHMGVLVRLLEEAPVNRPIKMDETPGNHYPGVDEFPGSDF